MAQVSRIYGGGAQNTQFFLQESKPHKPKALNSLQFRSRFLGSSNSWTLKHKNVCVVDTGRVCAVRVSASVATTEKPSMVPEIVLQPIKEISGSITLPGSKSLSNRILLLAALSEVYNPCCIGGICSLLASRWRNLLWVYLGLFCCLHCVRKCRKFPNLFAFMCLVS